MLGGAAADQRTLRRQGAHKFVDARLRVFEFDKRVNEEGCVHHGVAHGQSVRTASQQEGTAAAGPAMCFEQTLEFACCTQAKSPRVSRKFIEHPSVAAADMKQDPAGMLAHDFMQFGVGRSQMLAVGIACFDGPMQRVEEALGTHIVIVLCRQKIHQTRTSQGIGSPAVQTAGDRPLSLQRRVPTSKAVQEVNTSFH